MLIILPHQAQCDLQRQPIEDASPIMNNTHDRRRKLETNVSTVGTSQGLENRLIIYTASRGARDQRGLCPNNTRIWSICTLSNPILKITPSWFLGTILCERIANRVDETGPNLFTRVEDLWILNNFTSDTPLLVLSCI